MTLQTVTKLKESPIDVCVAFTDNDGMYVFFAATTLISIFENTSEKINIHVLHDTTLGLKGKCLLCSVAKQYSASINFYSIDCDLIDSISIEEGYTYTNGSFYRYYIPELINSEIVLYIDCDIIFTIDIKELYECINNKVFYIAAVFDKGADEIYHIKTIVKKCGLDNKKYFNSGVMLFHNVNIKTKFQSFSKSMVLISKKLTDSKFIDQNALNIAFQKLNIYWLNEKFNYLLYFGNRLMFSEKELQNKILHYSSIKPWCNHSLPASKVFYKYFCLISELTAVLPHDG